MLLTAAVFAATDLGIKAWAERVLADTSIEGGPLDLHLAFSPGVAFSVGANAPGWIVLAVTGVITTVVAVALWRTAPAAGRRWGLALAALLGGAVANLVDRAADGVVTDYLHSGWCLTFHLADTFIVLGGLACVVLSFTGSGPARERDRPASGAS
ncbi:signal peptidase II [Streptomyces sp. CdTB01]|uniref:signal peptidase II n=1 Tax=Streptomyces sp. CdTB01 TaxID=1725411 RepID=UPI00073AD307|nr:signal peptidase II [Streptomyces sp. CdTB01]ALV39190.1 hypothetical protein AS200_44600 [Streptomyces sp. CdTB01]